MRHYPAPITDRKIRFAVVGCGRIAANHLAAIAAHADRADLVDVCDVAPDALKSAVEKSGARGWSNLSDMLDKTEADAVVLTTPSGLHSEQTVEIAATRRN